MKGDKEMEKSKKTGLIERIKALAERRKKKNKEGEQNLDHRQQEVMGPRTEDVIEDDDYSV